MKDEKLYIAFSINSIFLIESFLGNYSYDEFVEDLKTYSACLHHLQNIADATKFFSEKLKARNNNIPWKKILGFRNVLVHDYLGDLDQDTVWKIIKIELPFLKTSLINELPNWKDYYKT
jgi:uncharacterized protein with HEPN domain